MTAREASMVIAQHAAQAREAAHTIADPIERGAALAAVRRLELDAIEAVGAMGSVVEAARERAEARERGAA